MAMQATHWNQSPIYGYLYIYHQAVYYKLVHELVTFQPAEKLYMYILNLHVQLIANCICTVLWNIY